MMPARGGRLEKPSASVSPVAWTPQRSPASRIGSWTLRVFRRASVAVARTLEAVALLFGGTPRKTERFQRLVEPEVSKAVEQITSAEAIVGIAFYRECENLPGLVRKALADLEERGKRAAIVVVGERKTQSLLLGIELPASTSLVRIVRFAKPFGFGQKPGLSRRSWSHWALFQIASRLQSDLIFIDADVRNTEGWVDLYLRAIQGNDADVAAANYIRSFGSDDAIVHIWDRLIFGALFGRWIEFRQGGDYAVSRRLVAAVLTDPLIMREGAYTLDSAVMAKVASAHGKIELVWLGRKEHEPVDPQRLFKRLPDLVRSVFEEIETHLPALLAMSGNGTPVFAQAPSHTDDRQMQELIGEKFREELYRDLTQRCEASFSLIRSTLGHSLSRLLIQELQVAPAHGFEFNPLLWAKSTFRFLARYMWKTGDEKDRRALAKAYVPVLEAGALSFLNQTASLSYREAMNLLEASYLPAFVSAWRVLSRRRLFHKMVVWRRWPSRFRSRVGDSLLSSRPGRRSSQKITIPSQRER